MVRGVLNDSAVQARRARRYELMRSLLLLCCVLPLHYGCMAYDVVTTIAFSPAGRVVAYVREAPLAEAAVDGKILCRRITLHRRTAGGVAGHSPRPGARLGWAFVGSVAVPGGVVCAPGGAPARVPLAEWGGELLWAARLSRVRWSRSESESE